MVVSGISPTISLLPGWPARKRSNQGRSRLGARRLWMLSCVSCIHHRRPSPHGRDCEKSEGGRHVTGYLDRVRNFAAVMTSYKFLISGEQRFFAVVIAGDTAAPTRLWICVAPDGLAAGSGWVGCWSSGVEKVVTASSFGRLLDELNAEVARVGRMGPFGPYLDDHLFFDGWDAWGSGIPSPIANHAPIDLLAGAENCLSSDDLVGRMFGPERRPADSD